GSCRLPAACCGVVGSKGTYGLISSEGILAGEPSPDEMIKWFSHPAVTARRVADAALVVGAVKRPNALPRAGEFTREVNEPRRLRVGAATNFKGDQDVAIAFNRAVETVAGLGYDVKQTVVPFAGLDTGIRHIERDRKAISHQLFGEIDVLLLPTTT